VLGVSDTRSSRLFAEKETERVWKAPGLRGERGRRGRDESRLGREDRGLGRPGGKERATEGEGSGEGARSEEGSWMAGDPDFRREFRPRRRAGPPLITRLPTFRILRCAGMRVRAGCLLIIPAIGRSRETKAGG